MKPVVLLMVLVTLVSACASPSKPVRSECFRTDGSPRCNFTPLPELWQREGGRRV